MAPFYSWRWPSGPTHSVGMPTVRCCKALIYMYMADGAGFEPARDLSASDPLAGGWFQPLTQPSGNLAEKAGFEPARPFQAYALSKRAQSTTLPLLHVMWSQ